MEWRETNLRAYVSRDHFSESGRSKLNHSMVIAGLNYEVIRWQLSLGTPAAAEWVWALSSARKKWRSRREGSVFHQLRLGIAGKLTEMNQKAFFSFLFLSLSFWTAPVWKGPPLRGRVKLSIVRLWSHTNKSGGGRCYNKSGMACEKAIFFFSAPGKLPAPLKGGFLQRQRRRRSPFSSQLRFIVEHQEEKKKTLAGCDRRNLPVKHKQTQPITGDIPTKGEVGGGGLLLSEPFEFSSGILSAVTLHNLTSRAKIPWMEPDVNKTAGHVTASASCSPAEEEVFLPMLHKVDAGCSASSDFLRFQFAPK